MSKYENDFLARLQAGEDPTVIGNSLADDLDAALAAFKKTQVEDAKDKEAKECLSDAADCIEDYLAIKYPNCEIEITVESLGQAIDMLVELYPVVKELLDTLVNELDEYLGDDCGCDGNCKACDEGKKLPANLQAIADQVANPIEEFLKEMGLL